MPEVFLSYSREDPVAAQRFAEGLERAGFSVWWDQSLATGEAWDEVTEQALREARAVVVLWSKHSVASRWVRAEATIADRAGTLVPVQIEDCTRPVMFELRQTADLSQWRGDATDPEWQAFVADVRRLAGKTSAGPATPLRPRPRPAGVAAAKRWRIAAVAGFAVAALSLLALTLFWSRKVAPPAAEPVRMTVSLPPGINATRSGLASSLALSPDGRTLVISGAGADGNVRLYARAIDRFEATPIEGTEGGSSPFFSPDGAWIGFFAEGRLKRVAVAGGPAVEITRVQDHLPAGASWGSDGRIAFVLGARSWVQVVDSAGGRAETLVALADDDSAQSQPEFLPDGRTLLFEAAGQIHALDLSSGQRVALIAGSAPRYLHSGHLVFVRGTTLLAAPYDAVRRTLTGAPVPLVRDLGADIAGVGRHYALSPNGHLAYLPGAEAYELVHRQPDGSEHLVTDPAPMFENPRFSPDGRRIAVAAVRRAGEPQEIWIHDLRAGAAARLTFNGGRAPLWTPDGSSVTYVHMGEKRGIYTRRADGGAEPEQLAAVDEFHWLVGWTPDARLLAYGSMDPVSEDGMTHSSILVLEGGSTRRILGPGGLWGGRLSPDGRWLVYYSQVAGRFEVYVTPFPGAGPRWLISDQGGSDPSWGPDGREIFYRNADRLLAASVDTAEGVQVVSRRVVVEPFSPPAYDDYHAHPDGSLALVRPVIRGRDVQVVLNWSAELDPS